VKYGAKSANPDASIHLHCRSMRFVHPVQKTMVEITADLPNEQTWRLFSKILG
jgi:23S rRNA pseudouridine1911/1915/1917 synthase